MTLTKVVMPFSEKGHTFTNSTRKRLIYRTFLAWLTIF